MDGFFKSPMEGGTRTVRRRWVVSGTVTGIFGNKTLFCGQNVPKGAVPFLWGKFHVKRPGGYIMWFPSQTKNLQLVGPGLSPWGNWDGANPPVWRLLRDRGWHNVIGFQLSGPPALCARKRKSLGPSGDSKRQRRESGYCKSRADLRETSRSRGRLRCL